MTQQHNIKEWFELARKLKEKANLSDIVLCGGEPLLVKNISKLAKDCSETLDLRVHLKTNGACGKKAVEKIAPYLSSISLPIEGSSEKINSARRGKVHLGKVLKTMGFLGKRFPDLPLIVGTVVSKKNAKDCCKIGELLLENSFGARFPLKVVWKLYQITKAGKGKSDKRWSGFGISEKKFDAVCKETKKLFGKKIRITTIKTSEMKGFCIQIRPNGEVIANTGNGKEIGLFSNIFANPVLGMRKIIAYKTGKQLKNRLESTYGF